MRVSANFRRTLRRVLLRAGALSVCALPLFGENANASLTPGWTPPLTIQNIVVETDGAILLIQGGIPATYLRDDCNASIYNFIDLSASTGKSMLSTALSAYMTGRQVSLALQACNAGRPQITNIQM